MTRAEQVDQGRRKMRDAFVRLSGQARWLGIDEQELAGLHGLFFDGNEEVLLALTP